jgi:hypothetical protein
MLLTRFFFDSSHCFRPTPLPVQDVRYVANAAGGLLPVLAEGLRDTFYNAAILTSYGMTEW